MNGQAQKLVAEIRSFDDPDLLAAWRDLYDRSLEPNIFLDPDFACPALAYLHPRGLKLVTIFEADTRKLLALAPIVPPRLPFGLARVYMHKQTALGLPLLDRNRARPALAMFLEAVRTMPRGAGALVFSDIPRDGPTFDLLRDLSPPSRLHILDEYERAALIPASNSADRKSKGQKNSERRLRRLGERGALSYRIAQGADVSTALAEFLALEARGWKGASQTALASTAERAAFAKTMAENLGRSAKLRIESLDLDGKPVAMGIFLEDGAQGYFWKIAYDEAYAAFSPGALLIRELTARLLSQSSLLKVDSCASAGQPMIDDVWPDRMVMVDIGLDLVGDMRGRIMLAAEKVRRSLRTHTKRLMRRGASGKAPIAASWRARS